MSPESLPRHFSSKVEANALILLANLGVLGLTLKLYTEYFKDKSQDRRRA